MGFRHRATPPKRGERLDADLVAEALDAIERGERREALPPLLLGPPSPSGRVLMADWWPRVVTARITAGTGPFSWVEQAPAPDDPEKWVDRPGGLSGTDNLAEVNDATPGGVRQRIYEVAPDRWRFHDVKAGPPPCKAIVVCVDVQNKKNRFVYPRVTNITLKDASGNVLDSGPPISPVVLERCVDVTALGLGAKVTATVTLETFETVGTPCTFTYTKDFLIPTCGTHHVIVPVCLMHHPVKLAGCQDRDGASCYLPDFFADPLGVIADVEFGTYWAQSMGAQQWHDMGCLVDPTPDPFTVTITPTIRGYNGVRIDTLAWDCDTTGTAIILEMPPLAAGFHCGCCQVPNPDVLFLSAGAGVGTFTWDWFRCSWFGSVPVHVPNKAVFTKDAQGHYHCSSEPGIAAASGSVRCDVDADGNIQWSADLSVPTVGCMDDYGHPLGPLAFVPSEYPDIPPSGGDRNCFIGSARPCPGVPINETLVSTPCNPPGGGMLADAILSLTE